MLLLDSLFWSCSIEVAGVFVIFPFDVVGASLLGTSDAFSLVPVDSTSISAKNSFCFYF